jgi:hypothetical protein
MELERLWNLVGKKISGKATEQELQEMLDMLEKDPDSHYRMQIISDLWRSAVNQSKSHSGPDFTMHWKERVEQTIALKYASLGLQPGEEEIIWDQEMFRSKATPETFMQNFVARNYFDFAWRSLLRYNAFFLGLFGVLLSAGKDHFGRV